MRIPTPEDYAVFDGGYCRSLWAATPEDWHCPACGRTKFELLRWTRRRPPGGTPYMGWMAALHRHHDHGVDLLAVLAVQQGRLVAAAQTPRERWAVHLGVLAGLRREEMRLLRREHFARAGFIHVSSDIAKGGRERWIPVLPELEPIVSEILLLVAPGRFVLPGRRSVSTDGRALRDVDSPISDAGLYQLVKRVGRRAGLAVDIGPHTLRHAFGDHVTRQAGLKVAQELMGHASSATTESAYTGRATLDELAAGVKGFAYGLEQGPPDRSAPLVSHNVDSGDPAAQSQTEKESR